MSLFVWSVVEWQGVIVGGLTGASSAHGPRSTAARQAAWSLRQDSWGAALAWLLTRAHSFPWKILPNSSGQFTKFHGLPWQNCPNSAVYHGLPFVSKLNSILLYKTSFFRLVWCPVMLATYKENYQFFHIQKCNLSISRIEFIYGCAILRW